MIPGSTWENISILGNFADGGYNTDANGDYTGSKDSKAHDGGFYNHQLEFSASAMSGYHKFLVDLLTQDGATLFHCSSGKDRTGIGSVLIMSALGMDPQTIAKDYMLSMTYNHTVKYSWLKEYYREINNYYTNMPNYLQTGLNFSPYQQELLKSKYLVSNDQQEKPYPAPAAPAAPSATLPTPATPHPQAPHSQESPQPQLTTKVPATKHKKSTIKVMSVKKFKKSHFVHVKLHRAYFYDLHLRHKVGLTKNTKTNMEIIEKSQVQNQW